MKLEELILIEAAYKGNIGMMEMFKFYQMATPAEKEKMKRFLDAQNFDDAWKFLQEVTGTPSKKIGDGPKDSDEIDKIVKDHYGTIKTDWTFGRASETKTQDTSCATREVRVMFEVTPEDDMGVDETVQDAQTIVVVRDRQTPKKIKFLKYGK